MSPHPTWIPFEVEHRHMICVGAYEVGSAHVHSKTRVGHQAFASNFVPVASRQGPSPEAHFPARLTVQPARTHSCFCLHSSWGYMHGFQDVYLGFGDPEADLVLHSKCSYPPSSSPAPDPSHVLSHYRLQRPSFLIFYGHPRNKTR